MSQWTPEHVLALAPDAASVDRARGLISPSKWSNPGCNDIAVWGEAKGSGATPYRTAVDLRQPAFSCTCPSPKFPCKHALALLLRYAQDQIPEAAMPEWVASWMASRDAREAKKAAKLDEPPKEIDPVAAAKRSERRWDWIITGLDECEAFLLDIAGQGLLAAQATRTWDDMAARMVDAQAPGVARKLRDIGWRIGVGRDWAASVTGQMGNLALLIEAARRIDQLSEGEAADVRTALGIPARKEDLKGEPIIDVWDSLGQILESHDHFVTCRTWLRSRSNGRWALLFSSVSLGQPHEARVLPGTAVAGALDFYPSAAPLRAFPREAETIPFQPWPGGTWREAQNEFSRYLAQVPWMETMPVHIADGVLGRDQEDWYVLDREREAMRLAGGDPYATLVHTGNEPANLFGEWNGHSLRLLGAWSPAGYVPA